MSGDETRARAAMVNDLLSSDGQQRPGDEIFVGLADALRPLDARVRMEVAAALYGRAVEALNRADNARAEATYISPEQYRRNWLDTAEHAARLWREAAHVN